MDQFRYYPSGVPRLFLFLLWGKLLLNQSVTSNNKFPCIFINKQLTNLTCQLSAGLVLNKQIVEQIA